MSRVTDAVRYAEAHGKRDSLTIYLASLVGALAGELIRAEREIEALRAASAPEEASDE